MPAPATLSADRYLLLDRLGAGGMASVWLAHDEVLNREVAIKIISDTLADDESWRERFAREARAAASVRHPNVVPVFDFGFGEDRPYLVMQYISGPSLATALKEGRDVDVERLANELLDAVAHVHDAGIVHRDITPSNVLLDEQGSVHLTDFGIAQSPDATSLTQTGMVIGTAGYLAPEVADGEAATPASDLYSAGRVIADAAEAAGTTTLDPLIERLTATDPADRTTTATLSSERTVPRASSGPTAPTRVKRSTPARARSGRSRAIGPAVAGATALAAVATLLIVTTGDHGLTGSHNTGSTVQRPSLPKKSAPLDEHLDALDKVINRAANR